MLRSWRLALLLVGLAVASVLAWPLLLTHGHAIERLDVTVRLVDRDSGRPHVGAVAAVIRHPSQLDGDEFERDLSSALRVSQKGLVWRYSPMGAVRTTDAAETAIVFSVHATRFRVGGLLVTKEVDAPEVLLIDHPKHGRTIITIDPETPLTEGDEPNTWRLDLGTVRVP